MSTRKSSRYLGDASSGWGPPIAAAVVLVGLILGSQIGTPGPDEAERVLQTMGFREPHVVRTEHWFVPLKGCRPYGGTVMYEAVVTQPDDTIAHRKVCCGWVHGCSVRP